MQPSCSLQTGGRTYRQTRLSLQSLSPILWMLLTMFRLIISKTSFLKKIIIPKIIISMRISSHKVPIFVVKFQQNYNFLDRFPKNIEVPNFVKILLVWAELFHCGQMKRQTRQEEANGRFSQFFEIAQKKQPRIRILKHHKYTFGLSKSESGGTHVRTRPMLFQFCSYC